MRALKRTNGCICMLDWRMAELIKTVRNNSLLFPGTVQVEVSGPAGLAGDIDERIEDGDSPSLTGGRYYRSWFCWYTASLTLLP